jgi:hypothetical protein
MKSWHRTVPVVALLALAVAGAAPAQTYTSNSQFRCESVNSREVSCRIPDGRTAEFVEQNSRSACVRGRTYFIEADAVIVTQGCRATFRLVDQPYGPGSPALLSEMRARLSSDLARMIRTDQRFSSTPVVIIRSDRDRPAGSSTVGYEGTARVERNGNFWNDVTFDASYDLRSRAFTRIDYDIADNDGGVVSRERMDEDLEAALADALSDEVRRQKGGDVQTVVNRRFRSRRDGGTVTYTGKFGYSWNDGAWVTRGYEANVNPSGQRVRSVRIYKLEGQ